ncbi:MAG: nucleotidyltransferase family protein [Candidatus Omnitrophota bacterium]
MHNSKETAFAAAILQTLLSDNRGYLTSLADLGEAGVQLLKTILRVNNVTVRTLSKWPESILSCWGLREMLENEKARVRRNIEFLARIKEALDREKYEYAVIKTLDGYPDLGHDLDLFILEHKEKVLEILRQQFGGSICSRVLSEILNDKTNVAVADLPKVELHYRRLGVLGEETLFPRILMKNKKLQQAEGNSFCVPCDEDRVLIAVDHRINRHFCIRLCDIYNTLTLINKKNFDWDYLWKIAEVRQIKAAARFYLDYIKRIAATVGPQQAIPALPFKRTFFRFPLLAIIPRSYAQKWWGFVKSFNLEAALRMSLTVPLLCLAGVQKLIGRKSSW